MSVASGIVSPTETRDKVGACYIPISRGYRSSTECMAGEERWRDGLNDADRGHTYRSAAVCAWTLDRGGMPSMVYNTWILCLLLELRGHSAGGSRPFVRWPEEIQAGLYSRPAKYHLLLGRRRLSRSWLSGRAHPGSTSVEALLERRMFGVAVL